jgi:hypothetical protein
VSVDNLLVVEPQPRNALLADAFKRIGLTERTGRGVDLIYQGLLRYGRPAPSYGRSSSTTVVVELSCAAADLAFLRLVLEQEARSKVPMPFDVEQIGSVYETMMRGWPACGLSGRCRGGVRGHDQAEADVRRRRRRREDTGHGNWSRMGVE